MIRAAGMALALVALAAPTAPAAADPGRAFDWTVGTWHGVRRSGSDGSEDPMTMRVEPILGGAGQARHLEVRQGDGIYRGFAVQAYDPDLGRWVRQYINDVRGRFVRLEGGLEGERSLWTVVSSSTGRMSRLVSERPGPGRWRRTMSISEDGGESWRVLWIDELEKEAGKP